MAHIILAIISIITVGCLLHQHLQSIYSKGVFNSSMLLGSSLFNLISLKSKHINFKFIFKLVAVHMRPMGLVKKAPVIREHLLNMSRMIDCDVVKWTSVREANASNGTVHSLA